MPVRQFLQRMLEYRFVLVRKPVLDGLKDLAEKQQRPSAAVAADLLSVAVHQQHSLDFQLRCWDALTPREQEVIALCCLDYLNAQIGERLGISVTTVSTHIRNVSVKFNLHGKTELRRFFAALDFSGWEAQQEAEDTP